jgi:hypothetical protein
VYGRRRRVLSSQANSSSKSDNHDKFLLYLRRAVTPLVGRIHWFWLVPRFTDRPLLSIGFCLSALMRFEPCDSKAPQNVSDDA